MVEVVSPGAESKPNYIRDYRDQRDQYAVIGIREYWIIDPEREWFMVGTLIFGAYQFKTFKGEATIVSPTFPELRLTTTEILSA